MSPHVNASRNGGKRFNNSDESDVSDEVLKKVHQKIRKNFDRKKSSKFENFPEIFENFRKFSIEILRKFSILKNRFFQIFSKIFENFSIEILKSIFDQKFSIFLLDFFLNRFKIDWKDQK